MKPLLTRGSDSCFPLVLHSGCGCCVYVGLFHQTSPKHLFGVSLFLCCTGIILHNLSSFFFILIFYLHKNEIDVMLMVRMVLTMVSLLLTLFRGKCIDFQLKMQFGKRVSVFLGCVHPYAVCVPLHLAVI